MMSGPDGLAFDIQDEAQGTRIKVIGVGGAGSNAVSRMQDMGVTGVEFHILNTDQQALAASAVPNKVAIGAKVTHGLGAGSDPGVGRQAALEDTERIIEILEGTDMVFITAGLGGGTGTGAAPVIASLAKELNVLTVAVVTTPFLFEGSRRSKVAEQGLAELSSSVDTIITVPNQSLLGQMPRGTSFKDALQNANDVLRQAVQGISGIITQPGLINRDFADLRAVMFNAGYAMLGTGSAQGEGALVEAARKAISGPFAEQQSIRGARGVLINIMGSSHLGIHDVDEACSLVRAATGNEDVHLNFGVVLDESMGEEVRITVIATGFDRSAVVEEPITPMMLVREEMLVLPPPMMEVAVEIVSTELEPVITFAPATVPEEPAPAVESIAEVDVPAYLRRDRRRF